MNEEKLADLYTIALKAVDAGARVHYRFTGKSDIDARTKSSPMDLATMVDGQTESEIVSAIRSLRPTDAIIGEEGGSLSGASVVTWIIDPLDGTTNYGYRGHAVAIGVEIDGARAIGVTIDTFHHRLYSAIIGHHALLDGDPIAASSTSDLARALVAIGFLPDPVTRSAQCRALERILPYVRDVRRSGCPALDFCAVASGGHRLLFRKWPETMGYRAGCCNRRGGRSIRRRVSFGCSPSPRHPGRQRDALRPFC
jgi:myo-inositol-1(or 4)-monophosphatase